MKQMLLIVNPRAGTCKANKLLPQIISVFNRADYAVTVYITAGPGDGRAYMERVAPGKDLVVCCGGDGTLNEIIHGLLAAGLQIPIGYIPCGSTNDFAASMKLPTDILEAATAIAEGVPTAYDVGKIGDSYFSYVASFGAFTKSSYATSQRMKNSFGFLAYLLSGIREVSAIQSIPVRLELEDQVIEDRFIFGAISNSTRLGRVLSLDPQRVDMADGKLELMLIRPPKDLAELTGCIRQLKKQQYDSRMITFHPVESLRLTCPPGTVWSLDGERYSSAETLEIANMHHAIRLMRKG